MVAHISEGFFSVGTLIGIRDSKVWPTRQCGFNSAWDLRSETLSTLLEAMGSAVLVILPDDLSSMGFIVFVQFIEVFEQILLESLATARRTIRILNQSF